MLRMGRQENSYSRQGSTSLEAKARSHRCGMTHKSRATYNLDPPCEITSSVFVQEFGSLPLPVVWLSPCLPWPPPRRTRAKALEERPASPDRVLNVPDTFHKLPTRPSGGCWCRRSTKVANRQIGGSFRTRRQTCRAAKIKPRLGGPTCDYALEGRISHSPRRSSQPTSSF